MINYIKLFNDLPADTMQNLTKIFTDIFARAGYTIELEKQDAERYVLQVIAGALQNLKANANANINEMFIDNMSNDSLDALGSLIGLTRRSSTPAKVEVTVFFNSPIQQPYLFYANTTIIGSNDNGDYKFRLLEDVYIDPTNPDPAAQVPFISETTLLFTQQNDDGTNDGADANNIDAGSITEFDLSNDFE